MNTETPRVFIAATRQNDGKTTTSLGLLSAIQRTYPRVGYIKPVGQRFVEIAQQKIDEDTVLMDRVYDLNCPLLDMSPIAVEADFTRKYLESANHEALVRRVEGAFDRVAWEKDFVLCEGSGHAGVGSVFDMSNAKMAKILGAKVIIISRGGIGNPIDEIALNQALFEKEGVEIIGVIMNKVILNKLERVTEFAQRGLQRRGLKLLGVVPHQEILCNPSVGLVHEELRTESLNDSQKTHTLIENVIVGAMGVQNATRFFNPGVLLITPGDREDIILAAAAAQADGLPSVLAGIVLTGNFRPGESVTRVIKTLPFPVLLAREDSYSVASQVHDLTVKTRPQDRAKISLIRDLITRYVDVEQILTAVT